MARPTKLTRQATAAICEAVRAGVQFEQACWSTGIAASTGFEWRARGEGRDPRRPATSPYREFAEAVARAEGAAWRDDLRAEFAECSEQRENSQVEQERAIAESEPFLQFSQSVARAQAPGTYRHDQAPESFAEPQNSEGTETPPWGNEDETEFAESGFIDTRENARAREDETGEPGFPEFSEPVARAREERADREPRRAPMPWLSKRSRTGAITEGLADRTF